MFIVRVGTFNNLVVQLFIDLCITFTWLQMCVFSYLIIEVSMEMFINWKWFLWIVFFLIDMFIVWLSTRIDWWNDLCIYGLCNTRHLLLDLFICLWTYTWCNKLLTCTFIHRRILYFVEFMCYLGGVIPSFMELFIDL